MKLTFIELHRTTFGSENVLDIIPVSFAVCEICRYEKYQKDGKAFNARIRLKHDNSSWIYVAETYEQIKEIINNK